LLHGVGQAAQGRAEAVCQRNIAARHNASVRQSDHVALKIAPGRP
jgi:hypothetical protein